MTEHSDLAGQLYRLWTDLESCKAGLKDAEICNFLQVQNRKDNKNLVLYSFCFFYPVTLICSESFVNWTGLKFHAIDIVNQDRSNPKKATFLNS